MKIAFLGTGRMGTELALHLLADHDLTVWNRTRSRTARLEEAGAHVADTPASAVKGADAIVTSLFGPDAVRETVIDPHLIPAGVPWLDTSTVSPADAEEFARAVPTYVAVPVVGTIGPARAGKLGVYAGTRDDDLRERALDIARPWADPERLRGVDTPAKAATGKLLANLALAVSAEGLREALALGDASGLDAEDILAMLQGTGLAFIAGMKAPFVRGERDVAEADFTVDAIAKDTGLMLDTADTDLPAVRAARGSLQHEQTEGRGSYDFSAILRPRD